MVFIIICAIAAVITVVLMRDQILPQSTPMMENASFSTPAQYTAPTIAPTTSGYRYDSILNNLRSISSALPEKSVDLDNSNPQSKAAKFIIYDDPLQLKPYQESRIKQRYVLTTLYYSTRGNDWTDNSLWLSNVTECMWYGIYCSSSRNTFLTKIILQNNNLSGSIPSEIKSLVNLTDVSLVNHNLSGAVLPIFTSLDKLKVLDLRDNEFHGELLPSIGQMQSLRILYLEGNKFTGKIPADIAKSQALVAITMHRNKLTGTMPDAICNALKDFTADCHNDYPINCSCCTNRFNECY